jgi:XXXCH domain-containing protein
MPWAGPSQEKTFMEKKITTVYAREELAAHLEDLAAQLRKGAFPIAAETFEVPESLDVTWYFKEKKHHVACKLEWRWATPEHRNLRDRPAEADELPAGFKQIKKSLARAFRSLKQSVNQGTAPDDRLLEEFENLSRAFVAQAQPEWKRAAREYLGHMDNLFVAIRDGRKEAMLHEVQDLQARMMACHKEFG